MNERELRLLHSLLGILRSIQQDIHAIHEQGRTENTNERLPTKVDIQSEIRLPVAVSEYYAAEQSEGPKDRRRDRIRLRLEVAALIAAVSAGFFTFRTLHQIQRQADAAQRQVAIMQQQLETTDRPWVTVEVMANTEWVPGALIGGPLIFDKDGRGSLAFKIIYKNIGKSVASHVYDRTEAWAMGITDRPQMALDEQRRVCNGPNTYTKNTLPIDIRYTLFPQDPQVAFVSTGFETKQIAAPSGFGILKNGKPVQPFIIGCVDYDYAYSTVPHQTGFIYEVYGSKAHQGIQTLITIPVDRLTFEPYAFGGKYAY